MEFLKESYSVFVGAALIQTVIGFLSALLINNRVNRSLELYKKQLAEELQASKAALDAVLAQSKTKFDCFYPKRLDAAKELMDSCKDIREKFRSLIAEVASHKNNESDSYSAVYETISKKLYAIGKLMNNYRPLLTDEFNDAVKDYFETAMAISHDSSSLENKPRLEMVSCMNQQLVDVESAYKKLLGNNGE